MNKPYQDEVFEWAFEMNNKYNLNPMYFIGCLDTYMGFSRNIEDAKEKIEDKVRRECDEKKAKAKRDRQVENEMLDTGTVNTSIKRSLCSS